MVLYLHKGPFIKDVRTEGEEVQNSADFADEQYYIDKKSGQRQDESEEDAELHRVSHLDRQRVWTGTGETGEEPERVAPTASTTEIPSTLSQAASAR